MTTILLDTHVVHWWFAEPERLSPSAIAALEDADVLAVAAITWFELAWLATHGRITVSVPVRSWLEEFSGQMRTIDASPAVAATAASLPRSFPQDPSDRLIYATAIEYGWQLVTRDERMRRHRHPRQITVW